MAWVVGVRFKPAGKVYYFDSEDMELVSGETVIVETVRGIEYGVVALGKREIEDDQLVLPLKKVLRKASQEDETAYLNNRSKEVEALEICKQKVKEHNLPMRLIDVEYTFDMGKIIFYFTSESRVDFRELVKDLAAIFKTRIELRQIGVRDEAKMLGGIATCGRVLCCKQFLGEFEPVSIRMAKEQNLSLNPTKISGVCGRLMCCLKYESELYDGKRPEGVKNGENHSGTENTDQGTGSGGRGSKRKGNQSGKKPESAAADGDGTGDNL